MTIGLLSLLGIIFMVLKLCSVITWGWWLVLMPFYIQIILMLGIYVIWAIAEDSK